MSGARSIREVVEAAAAGLGDVERVTTVGALELRRSGRAFARLEGTSVAFRLDPPIVAAALRTADTAPSPLGPEWVTFTPPVVDSFAVDRAAAWLEAAWRRAAPSARS